MFGVSLLFADLLVRGNFPGFEVTATAQDGAVPMCEADDRAEAFESEMEGFIAAANGDYDEAIRLYTRALFYSSTSSPEAQARVLRERGDIWCKIGDYDRAIADYDEAIALNPRKAAAFYKRAAAKAKHGDAAGAEADIARTRNT